jgi:putative ABC transport system substrate-binding protein
LKRRTFITLLGGAAAAWPLTAHAQQSKLPVIGFLGLTLSSAWTSRVDAFRAGLRDLGYQEGRDVIVEYRWADGMYDRLPALLAELVRLKVDLIITHGTPGVTAAKQTTSTIPIVMAVVGDALGSGIVSSLARPEGNVTGSTFFQPELAAKRVELLKETMPDLTDVGILLNPTNRMNDSTLPQMSQVAQSLKLTLHEFGVRGPGDFDGAFAAMATRRVAALVVLDDATLISNAPALAALSLRRRLPSCGWSEFAIDGGLFSYGVDFPDLFRRSATFVVKILKGAKPVDLPIERATKFETIVNLQTAKALGIDVPTSLLLRADKVIE